MTTALLAQGVGGGGRRRWRLSAVYLSINSVVKYYSNTSFVVTGASPYKAGVFVKGKQKYSYSETD